MQYTDYRDIFLLRLLWKVHAKCLEKDAAKYLKQRWMISSAVLVLVLALHTKFYSPVKFEKSWKYVKDVYTCFLVLDEAYDRVLRENTRGVLREQTIACYRPLSYCILAQKLVSVSAALNHKLWPWVMDSDKGMWWTVGRQVLLVVFFISDLVESWLDGFLHSLETQTNNRCLGVKRFVKTSILKAYAFQFCNVI